MTHPRNIARTNPALRRAGFVAAFTLFFFVVVGLTLPGSRTSAEEATPTPSPTPPTEMPKLGIKPVGEDGIFFTETIEPGKSADLSVEFFNPGSFDIEVLTYAADVYSLINGGFGAELAGEPASGTTTWLSFEPQQFDLRRGKGVQVPFAVAVPEETAPGEYITSLVIQTAEAIKGTGDLAVDQILRQAVAVAITVPGDQRPGLELGAASYKDNAVVDSLLFEVRNTGNVHLKPQGTVRIVDATGAEILSAEVAMDTVYAGTTTMLELGLSEPFRLGEYQAFLELGDPDRGGHAAADGVPLAVTELTELTTTSVQVDNLSVDLVRTPDGKTVQFANVGVSVRNSGETVQNTQIVLSVERDGELVEEYPLTSDAPLETGPTSLQQRYLPLTGWMPGSYSFTVSVETVDPSSGNVTVLATSAEPVVHVIA